MASFLELEITEEFLSALELDEEANEQFNSFTIGIKRSLVHYVKSAKTMDTKIKRSLELLHKIKNRELGIQKKLLKTLR